ncbi:AAC_HP2_G0038830.mRNA.1.CDS.1 [Saccharomyces cerevisiae]|nr:AAC_HP2_G0038830.mRNA.1.CDS.1 [Saccharomyces cerevisiae]CAI6679439.1 AAC_HP2_G0038830.mRNA.1.CDS.1 [Saccharomyces cerevisiae]CAI6684985.1 AAC_HP1_G0039890.mRNA.1.CDS.1 [Saccharomyces cerevisiae]CAI6827925.1 AAC_collapsed_G0039410.mRNA.1.CDS.1 [Saccharomyces cerevisiae]CAI7254543.1 ATV_collapsed_G0039380.mRNA.1.CDS.1 [Saccharomyces cerevisiae]
MSDTTEVPRQSSENDQDNNLERTNSLKSPDVTNNIPSLFKLAAEWQINNPQETFQNHILENDVLKKINEITHLIRESYKDLSSQDGMMSKQQQEKMDWDLFCTVAVNIIEQYTKDMDEIYEKMERLAKQQRLWCESAFQIDVERCGDSILNAETWMKKKERHLEYKNIEMERSANEIKETIQRLTDDR